MYCKNGSYLILLFFVIVFTVGCCDGFQVARGVVFDKTTKKPIDRVYIHKLNNDNSEYSDSTGTFKIHSISGGSFFCPTVKIVFYKKGYQSITNDMDKINDTVFLEKIK
jgi:hypothetical protein